jgi:DNA-binding LacI/PurR family transcriptional regulator
MGRKATPQERIMGAAARIAVASRVLGSGFSGLVYSHLRAQKQPGHEIVECAVIKYDPDHVRARLLKLLEAKEKPTALICVSLRPDLETIAAFREAGAPVVLIDEEQQGASTVASNNVAGGLLAGKFLVESGRREIGLVIGQLIEGGGYNAHERLKGFRQALAQAHVPLKQERIVEVVEYSRAEGVAALATLLQQQTLDAVFSAAGDLCATGLLAAAREKHLKVPHELAILGYDDNPVAMVSNPPLTTVRQPLEQMAAEAFRLATDARDEILAKPARKLFDPEIVKRASA